MRQIHNVKRTADPLISNPLTVRVLLGGLLNPMTIAIITMAYMKKFMIENIIL